MAIKAIVTDIEGTTTSLDFVKEVLFPYARKNMANFITQNADNSSVMPLIDEVRQQAGVETLDEVITRLITWIDQDKKVTVLKSLQGLLWEAGYKRGDFKGHIYADAHQQLMHWHEQGIKLYVYSSGSVYAQKLLFGHTEYGDLNHLFSGYFDTNIGGKLDLDSYRNIVDALDLTPGEILFLSDIEGELEAAKAAGIHTLALVRQGGEMLTSPYPQVSSFTDIALREYQ